MRADGRIDLQRIAVPGALPGDSVQWDGMRLVPSPGSSGGGLLGIATALLYMGNVTSNGTPVTSTGWNVYGTHGDPDLALDGINLVLADSDTPSYYEITTFMYVTPSTNTTTSDVFEVELLAPLVSGSHVGLGTGLRYYTNSGGMVVGGRAVTDPPTVTTKNSAGTNRLYLLGGSLYVTITRYAVP